MTKLGELNKMPDIYYIENAGILRTAWKK